MATQAISGVGTILAIGNGASPEVFTPLAEVRTIDGPNEEAQSLEATNLDSTGGYREYIPGFLDGGDLNFEANWTLGAYGVVKALFQARAVRNWKITYPNDEASTEIFSGFIRSLGKAIDFNDIIKSSVTLKVTGVVDLTS
jgi:predicted secreted protein